MTTRTIVPPDAPILAWHWLHDSGRLCVYGEGGASYCGEVVTAGKTYHVIQPIECCANGLHGAIRALDALALAPGAVVCRTWHYGQVEHDADGTKFASEYRTVLWLHDATRTLHLFACWCAEQALLAERAAGRVIHPALFAAIACKRSWLDGKASDGELDTARSAARSAATSAVHATESATESAAWSAAVHATESAARSAMNTKLEEMLTALAPALRAGR